LALFRVRKRRARDRHGRQAGVTLVEFAIVLPIFITMLFAMIEFGFAFNAVLGINRASQSGSLVAGQAGSDSDADCLILARIEDLLQAPIDKSNVLQVQIFRANSTGSGILASNVYVRSGSKNCGTFTVPYSATSTGYPESQRCNVLAGCPGLSPPRSTVDKIGVQITYKHVPVTPMRNLLSFLGSNGSGYTWTFVKQNVSRMEPVL
jgi:Flp pilus assembly protein TadG